MLMPLMMRSAGMYDVLRASCLWQNGGQTYAWK